MSFSIYPSSEFDLLSQYEFLNGHHLRYKHLDWVPEKQRLIEPFAFTLLRNNEITGMLSCAAESDQAAWLRYFICKRNIDYAEVFNTLLNTAEASLNNARIPHLYALGLPEWFSRLLINQHFTIKHQIISLHLDPSILVQSPKTDISDDTSFNIRTMTQDDFKSVLQIDQRAFEPQWQLGLMNLKACFRASKISLVLTWQNEVLAYLMSEQYFDIQHISRLAVDPAFHGKGIANCLLNTLINEALINGASQISVNTNDDNTPGLALYQSLGFVKSDERIPVYALSVLQ